MASPVSLRRFPRDPHPADRLPDEGRSGRLARTASSRRALPQAIDSRRPPRATSAQSSRRMTQTYVHMSGPRRPIRCGPSVHSSAPRISLTTPAARLPREDFAMSSERKAFLVWWTALLLFIVVAAFIKHNKMRNIHEQQGDLTTVNPASTPGR